LLLLLLFLLLVVVGIPVFCCSQTVTYTKSVNRKFWRVTASVFVNEYLKKMFVFVVVVSCGRNSGLLLLTVSKSQVLGVTTSVFVNEYLKKMWFFLVVVSCLLTECGCLMSYVLCVMPVHFCVLCAPKVYSYSTDFILHLNNVNLRRLPGENCGCISVDGVIKKTWISLLKAAIVPRI
jgi:hypothetical protein